MDREAQFKRIRESDKTAAEKLEQMTSFYRGENPGLTFRQALDWVSDAEPELVRQRMEEADAA